MSMRRSTRLTRTLTVILAAAAGLTHLMKALLFEVSPFDPTTYGAVSVVLALAALLASYIPAHRATTIEPVEALRVE